jgi:hypothetical protein
MIDVENNPENSDPSDVETREVDGLPQDEGR